ncbi:MAG: acyl-ACP thioesterase [Alloprevotella sp.]|nr:acyl-ACP thioesterase [Alloprevotella sp.]
MTKHPNIGTYGFTVEPFSEDFTNRISWANLGNLMLRCAQYHADSHAFGFGPMSKERLSWVFSRLTIQMERRPMTGEHFFISTWATDVQRGFTTRLFEVADADGHAYGWGHSIWALINLDTREPDDMQRLLDSGFRKCLVPAPDFPLTGQPRIRVRASEPAARRTVRYTDLDVNGHLNSIRSIDMLLDLFPKDCFCGDALRRVDMAYAHECFAGEEIGFFCDDALPAAGGSLPQSAYNLEMRRSDGQTAVRARLEFSR